MFPVRSLSGEVIVFSFGAVRSRTNVIVLAVSRSYLSIAATRTVYVPSVVIEVETGIAKLNAPILPAFAKLTEYPPGPVTLAVTLFAATTPEAEPSTLKSALRLPPAVLIMTSGAPASIMN